MCNIFHFIFEIHEGVLDHFLGLSTLSLNFFAVLLGEGMFMFNFHHTKN